MTCPGRFPSFDNNDFRFDRPDVPFDEGCCPRNPWSDFAAHFVWGARRPVIFIAVFREPPLIGAPEPEFIDFTPLPFERSPSGFGDRQPYAAKDDPGPTPPGFVAEKWENPDYHSIKYDVSRNFARVVHRLHAIPDEAGRKRFAEQFLKSQIPLIESLGGKVLQVKNEKLLLDAGDGKPHWIDTIRDIGGDAALQWTAV